MPSRTWSHLAGEPPLDDVTSRPNGLVVLRRCDVCAHGATCSERSSAWVYVCRCARIPMCQTGRLVVVRAVGHSE